MALYEVSSWLFIPSLNHASPCVSVALAFIEAFTAVAKGRESRWEGTASGGGGGSF